MGQSLINGLFKQSVIDVPWMKEEDKAKLNQSTSSDMHHFVKASGYLYKCDEKCPMFKGFSLCAPVAAAQVNGQFHALIDSFTDKSYLISLQFQSEICHMVLAGKVECKVFQIFEIISQCTIMKIILGLRLEVLQLPHFSVSHPLF